MKKAIDFLQKNMFFVIIIIIGVAYILTGTSNIIPSGETVGSIVASSGLGTILGWLISAMFGQQAIKDGYDDPDVISATERLADEVDKVEGHISKLDTYCEIENEAVMTRKRKRILSKVGLTLDVLKSLDKGRLKVCSKRQKKAIDSALNIGWGYLSADWLLSDIEEKEEKDSEKPVSINRYTFKKNISNLITKTITGIASGLFILEPFVTANWNVLIWRLFFYAMWLAFGYARYITDLNFMTKTYKKTIISKKNSFIKFGESIQNNPEWYSTCEEDKPIIAPQKKDNPPTESITEPITEAIQEIKEVGESEYGNIIEPIPET